MIVCRAVHMLGEKKGEKKGKSSSADPDSRLADIDRERVISI